MGRRPNTDERRQQIVDALLEEMGTVGYERASARSIASRAGLAPGLLHYHFGSKEEILLVLVDQLIEAAEARLADALATAPDAPAQLAAYIESRVGLGGGSAPREVRAWVAILAEAMGQPKVRSRVAAWMKTDHARLAALFVDAGADNGPSKAAALLALILGTFSLHAIAAAVVPRGYAAKEALAWLQASLPPRAKWKR